MCMFCAAIPVAAAAGVTLDANQLKAKRQAQENNREKAPTKPVMQLTAGAVVLLLVGSVTYHSLTYLP